ncbi:MAG: Na/Pi cotransporter family protein [Betaproteobacteria bacterium]
MQNLLNLLSAIALLVWGTHLVRAGILRIYGAKLREVLSRSVSNRFTALLAGLGVTGLIQSSTATALIATSFTSRGLITTAPALAIMLGADIGTSMMVQVFSLNLSWLSPLLLFSGVVLFLSWQNGTAGRIGRVLIGLGLIILALKLILVATQPFTQGAGVKVMFASLTGDILLDMLVGALFAVLSYSSLAVVLLTSALVSTGIISVKVALALVLGANLGSGILAVLTTLNMSPEARRVPLGNLIFKLLGCLMCAPFLGTVQQALASFDPNVQRMVVNFHLLFNLALAAVFIYATGPVARLTERLLVAPRRGEDPSRPRYLDDSALATPSLAIACAAREALRLGDVVETMLKGVMTVLQTNDIALGKRLRALDDTVDDLYTAIKLYMTQISHEALEDAESRRWTDIVSFTINMEHVGDMLERILIDLEEKKILKNRSFSEAGMAEICDLHQRLVANLQLGLSIFLEGDLKSAQRLIEQKEQFRNLEMSYADNHIMRLVGNTPQSIETSSLHLDLISDMKRINSHICSIAYPILEQAGVLSPSRLRQRKRAAAPAALPPGEPRHV